MNKLHHFILGLAATCMLASCSDFLDKSPLNSVDPETNVTDDVAVALTTACYRTLQSSNMYNQRLWTLDIVAGNSEVGAGGGTDGLETIQAADFITQSDNAMALYMWRSPWVGIGQCNIVLNSLPGAADVSDAVRNRCMGEAYFLRAHYYFILVRLYGGVYRRLGVDFGIVNSLDGYDEISLTGSFKVSTNRYERIFHPSDIGLDTVDPQHLQGGATVEEAKEIFDSVLENRALPDRKNVVLANAAFGIQVVDPSKTLEEAVGMARRSLESGRALEVFRKFVEINS